MSVPRIATFILAAVALFSSGIGVGMAVANAAEPDPVKLQARPVLAALSPVTFTVPVYVGAFQEAVDAMKFYDEVARISAATDGWSGDPATAGGGGPVPVVPRLPGGSIPSTGPSSCEGKVVPAAILYRESHCSYDAYNATGCGGSGCIGMYQLDAKHFNAGGPCAGLDTSPGGQDACAQRLVDAAGLRPWSL